jgi:hypothetical protein
MMQIQNTQPDFRALCAELVEKIDYTWGDIPGDVLELMNAARVALAAEQQGPQWSTLPSDEGWFIDFAKWLAREMPPGTVISNPMWWAPRVARAVLTRYLDNPWTTLPRDQP